jgi:succinate dehydrogenase/fumarate reductase-like Fe-S protein
MVYNCGFNLLSQTNLNETQIQQQFYENENQQNWKFLDYLKNLREKKEKIRNFSRDCNTAYCNYEKIFIQNLRATIYDIHDVS